MKIDPDAALIRVQLATALQPTTNRRNRGRPSTLLRKSLIDDENPRAYRCWPTLITSRDASRRPMP